VPLKRTRSRWDGRRETGKQGNIATSRAQAELVTKRSIPSRSSRRRQPRRRTPARARRRPRTWAMGGHRRRPRRGSTPSDWASSAGADAAKSIGGLDVRKARDLVRESDAVAAARRPTPIAVVRRAHERPRFHAGGGRDDHAPPPVPTGSRSSSPRSSARRGTKRPPRAAPGSLGRVVAGFEPVVEPVPRTVRVRRRCVRMRLGRGTRMPRQCVVHAASCATPSVLLHTA
jgi:hypothetical protein